MGIISLNRPPRFNAPTKELLLELNNSFDEIELEPSVKAIIFKGSAGKTFSSSPVGSKIFEKIN